MSGVAGLTPERLRALQAVADGRVSYRSSSGLRDNAWRIDGQLAPDQAALRWLAAPIRKLVALPSEYLPDSSTRATVTDAGRAVLREGSPAH